MAEFRQLTHPPLREALIDLHISEELPSSFIEKVAGRPPNGYETAIKVWRGSFAFQASQDKAVELSPGKSTSEQYGWRYDSKDTSRVVQLRRDGATYSVLKGYTNWDDVKSSAQELWKKYCELGSPRLVTRLAVRYINLMELPPGADTDIYFTAGPRIAAGLPQMFNGFLHRVVIPFAPEEATAIVTLALEQPLASKIPIVLDIEVVRSCTLAPDSPEIWAQLDRLRDIKNRVFFASVTEKALEAYQ